MKPLILLIGLAVGLLPLKQLDAQEPSEALKKPVLISAISTGFLSGSQEPTHLHAAIGQALIGARIDTTYFHGIGFLYVRSDTTTPGSLDTTATDPPDTTGSQPDTTSSQPDTTQTVVLQGDFDGSGAVDFSDFLAFTPQFGNSVGQEGFDPQFDLDANGSVAFSDFLIFIQQFGKTSTGKPARTRIPPTPVRKVSPRPNPSSPSPPPAARAPAQIQRPASRPGSHSSSHPAQSTDL